MEFIDALAILNEPTHPNFADANQLLNSLLDTNPDGFLEGIRFVITKLDAPLQLRIHAIKFASVVARLTNPEGSSDTFVSAVQFKEGLSPEAVEATFEVLMQCVVEFESVIPEGTPYDKVIEFTASAIKSAAHFRIAQYLDQGNFEDGLYPALQFNELITPEANQTVCDAAAIAIDTIVDSLPLSQIPTTELIITNFIQRIATCEATSLTFKHLFINISGKLLKLLGSSILEGNIEFGSAFLKQIDALLDECTEETFWFWAEVPAKCYRLLRIASDLPQIIEEKISAIIQELEGMDQENREKADNIMKNTMRFWASVAKVERKLPESFEFTIANTEQILRLALFIMCADQSTDTFGTGEYNSLIAAMDTIKVVSSVNYPAAFAILTEYIDENFNSESEADKFAAAFCYNTLLSLAEKESEELANLAQRATPIMEVLSADESPRNYDMLLSIIITATIKEAIEVNQEILALISGAIKLEDENIQMNSLKCFGIIGKLPKYGEITGSIIENLLEVVTEFGDSPIAAEALKQIGEVALFIDKESQVSLFDTICQLIESIIGEQDHSCLQPAIDIIYTIFQHLCYNYKEEIDEEHIQKFAEIGIALLETSSAAAGILCLNVTCQSFYQAIPDLVTQLVQIIEKVLTERDNKENVVAAVYGCLSIIEFCQEVPEVIQMFLEKNLEVIKDELVDPNVQALSLRVFNTQLACNAEFVMPYIEVLTDEVLRMLNTSDRFSNMSSVYNIIVSLYHVIEPGTDGEPRLAELTVKAINDIGMMSMIPESLNDVAIDLLYNLASRFGEVFEEFKDKNVSRKILRATCNSTDPQTIQRRNELVPQIVE